jgi:peptidylprolyl isomerase
VSCGNLARAHGRRQARAARSRHRPEPRAWPATLPRAVTHRTFTLCALGLVLLAAGCGGNDSEEAATPSATPPAGSTPARTGSPTAAADQDVSKRPVIEKPTGDPPSRLKVQDLVKGDGKRAKKGDNVTVQYVGVSFSTGEQFDASWDAGQPFSFPLGAGQVIPGWDKGVAGMRVGGRRKLTIPPDQAYGTAGSPPSIGPNEALVFVIDMVRIG